MIRIRTLIENSNGPDGTAAEHGLSFFIERDGTPLLFDTGESGAFMDNARVLGVDLLKASSLVVSHGHYDHGGGVRPLYEQGGFRGPFWTGPGFFDKKWSLDPEGPRYTGVDYDEPFFDSLAAAHETVGAAAGGTAVREVIPGVFAVNGFPRIHSVETPISRFVVDRGGRRVEDDFSDEVCLALPTAEGLVVVLGCAHPGLMNMVDAILAVFGKPLRAVLGGSHLVSADEGRIGATLEFLKESGCALAALGHCTGEAGIGSLAARLPAYRPLSVGAEFIM